MEVSRLVLGPAGLHAELQHAVAGDDGMLAPRLATAWRHVPGPAAAFLGLARPRRCLDNFSRTADSSHAVRSA